jgi:hypothetical protein
MVFAITNAREYREKVEEDLTELASDIANSSRAINAATSVYHLHEWLWTHTLKPKKPVTLGSSTIKNYDELVKWLDDNCPHFTLIQELANGSKHAYPVVSGRKVEGYGQGPWGIGPYNAPYLLLDLGGNKAPANRYLVASDVIQDAGVFMVKFAKSQGA